MTTTQHDALLATFDAGAREMEDTFTTLLGAASDPLRAHLVTEQSNWLQYKQARFTSLEVHYGLLSTGPGTLDRQALLTAETKIFTDRTAELKKYLDEIQATP